jgi:hypothetical protein
MKVGRPTDYTEELLQKARDYVSVAISDEKLPSIAGLAKHLGLSRSTIYDWASQEDKKEFSYILEDVLSTQEEELINKGLTGKYNSTITKLILTKHGYSDKADVTSDGQKIEAGVVVLPSKNEY